MYWELQPRPQVQSQIRQQSTKGFHQVQMVIDKKGKRIVLLTKDSKKYSLSKADQFHSIITSLSPPIQQEIARTIFIPFPT